MNGKSCTFTTERWVRQALDKALKCPENHYQGWPLAQSAGKTVLGRRLALLGTLGQRAPAHGVHSLERSREVWAAWRALFLPDEVGAGFAPFGSRR